MRRLEFITLLGGVVATPLVARGQQRDLRVAVLMSLAENDPEGQGQSTAFAEGMNQLGWNQASNLHIIYRWAAGDGDRLRAFAAELVALKPDVILLNGTPALSAVRQHTQSIAIVFVNVADPVGSGFVASLARPGGNVTGFTTYESSVAGKWLQLLKEIAPSVIRSLVIFNSKNQAHKAMLRAIDGVASSIDVKVAAFDVSDPASIGIAIDEFAAKANGGIVVLPDFQTTTYRDRIIESAARNKLPGVFPFQSFATSGGLLVYGVDSFDLYRQGAASYVDRILRGTKPADLPIQAPTKFKLVINLRSAKHLGIDVPPTLFASADEVIE